MLDNRFWRRSAIPHEAAFSLISRYSLFMFLSLNGYQNLRQAVIESSSRFQYNLGQEPANHPLPNQGATQNKQNRYTQVDTIFNTKSKENIFSQLNLIHELGNLSR